MFFLYKLRLAKVQVLSQFEIGFCVLDDFFRFSKKSGFWEFLVHPKTTLPDGLETSGRRAYR
jgi:hypothetical protein